MPLPLSEGGEGGITNKLKVIQTLTAGTGVPASGAADHYNIQKTS